MRTVVLLNLLFTLGVQDWERVFGSQWPLVVTRCTSVSAVVSKHGAADLLLALTCCCSVSQLRFSLLQRRLICFGSRADREVSNEALLWDQSTILPADSPMCQCCCLNSLYTHSFAQKHMHTCAHTHTNPPDHLLVSDVWSIFNG